MASESPPVATSTQIPRRELGLDPTDTIDLVTNAIGYKNDREAIRQHYQQPCQNT